MRTDSTSLSQTAIDNIAETIEKNYGARYLNSRQYNTKKANAQEAHEAIRPTYVDRQVVSQDPELQRLYDLIWKRTIASQMSNAKFERTSVKIGISTLPNELLSATGEVLKFEGFLKVYHESRDEDAEDENGKNALPPLKEGQKLELDHMQAMQRFTRPPSRYTEASLVKKLEELGIGRPSTYAPTITKIMEPARGYVVRESREGVDRSYTVLKLKSDNIAKEVRTEITGATSKRLYATDIGMLVTDFLSEHFEEIMNYGFTAEIEKRFDTIAAGQLSWNDMLSKFYNPFHEKILDTRENATRARGRRDLGIDPETGHTILVQITRYGPVVQIGTREEVGEEGKPKFANMKQGQSMETITLEEAKELFKLPKTIGEYLGKEVTLGAGRYGPYVKYEDIFVSLPRGEDPMDVTLERASELIATKLEENKPIGTYQDKPITKGKGRFGPYFKWNGLFVNIPKRYDPDTITFDEAIELIKAKAEKEANRYIKIFEKQKINIENGRWGPFIRKGRKSISIPKVEGKRINQEQAKELTLEEVKQIIEGEMPESVIKRVKESVEE
jgi:DNA topoisomerase-1